MKRHRKKMRVLVIVIILGFSIGVILASPEKFGICEQYQYNSCITPLGNIGQPVGMLSLSLLPISLLLLFLREEIYNTWKHFALWFIPLSALLIFLSSDSGSGVISGSGALLDTEGTAFLLAGMFLFVSLILIAVKWWKLRKADQKV